MSTGVLDGQTFKKLVAGGAANLSANADIVNDLNVFPIPDGDTGANMSMTIGGGVKRLEDFDGDSVAEASKRLADGMLLSARGNSGVILSQLFAGIAAGFENKETATVSDVGEAVKKGVECAYSAVVDPTEGTILTVAREACEYAVSRIDENSTFESLARDCLKEMSESLKRTPELLHVLREAEVIDSGGAGLYYIMDGVVKTYSGEEIGDGSSVTVSPQNEMDLSAFNEDSVMKFGYCTEFLLQLQKCKIHIPSFSLDELVDYLNSVGDSVVAFMNGSVVKVHVHTMTPGAVLEHCQRYGEFLTLKIENMTIQHNETSVQNRFRFEPEKKKKPFATVTVATGEGIRQTFSDLGADYVIDGGQGKNPSAEDFIDAFNEVNAETVFVLPNNGNIIMAARQAAELYRRSNIVVIESHDMGDGYAALTMLSYDSGDTAEIKSQLEDAMEGVVTGLVTTSVRDASIGGVDIKKGDYIGFTSKDMLVSTPSKIDTMSSLAEKLHVRDHEYVIAVYGAGATEDDKDEFRARIKSECPTTELYEIDGGQDVYDVMLILQ